MSIPLRPQEEFVIVRQLDDHTDATTYYVRAVIRDAKTDELLVTLPLNDKGDRRFSKKWYTVADPTGLGRYISVLTEVFTDAGFTTKSSKYGDEMETYRVQEERNRGGGSYSVNIDYKKIEKMLDDKVKAIKMPEVKIPANQKVNLDSLNAKLDQLSKAIKGIKMPAMPEQEPIDLQPVIQSIEAVRMEVVEGIRAIPGRDEDDILPLARAIEAMEVDTFKQALSQVTTDLSDAMNILGDFIESVPEFRMEFEQMLQQAREAADKFAPMQEAKKLEATQQKAGDFTRLASRLRAQ